MLLVPALGKPTRCLSAFLLAFGAAGCALPTAEAEPSVAVSLRVEVRPAGRSLLALVAPYTVADVASLDLQVFQVTGAGAGESEWPLLDAGANPVVRNLARDAANGIFVDGPRVQLLQLKANSHYRIKASAYADAAKTLPIAESGASSHTNLFLTNTPEATVVEASVQVQLINRSFSGSAEDRSGVAITPGGFAGVPMAPP